MTRRKLPVAFVAGLLALASCTLVAGIERGYLDADVDGGGSRDAVAPADDAGIHVDGAPADCPAGMVRVTRAEPPTVSFCIDTTEVNNRNYLRFLAQPPQTAGQIPECAWNTDFQGSGSLPSAPPNAPVVAIDWCDAYAYCKWLGKRLCGRVGGGPADYDDAGTITDEWFTACSSDGTSTYPYSPTYDPLACIGQDNPAGSKGPVDVGSAPKCTGPAGVFDMSGNVWEYEDACKKNPDGGASPELDVCRRRGGSYNESAADLRCAPGGGSTLTRSFKSNETGFRCCAD